jgi:hypothetical protein
MLECELPDPDRFTLYDPLKCPWAEPVRELFGLLGELLLGRDFLGDFAPSDPDRTSDAFLDFISSSRCVRCSGDPGAELDFTSSACGMVGLRFGLAGAAQVEVGDIWAFDERRRRLSMSSSTIFIRRSAGSSKDARLIVNDRSCSASLSHPKNCRKSISLISRALIFLKAYSGTAESNGNSSYPSISRARRSGASRRQGIFVKAEYRYFRSASRANFCFSVRAAELPEPKPKLDHRLVIPDITLLTLDTE